MTGLYKLWCRIFQKVMWVACHFLNFTEPKIIKGEGCITQIPDYLKKENVDSVLIVTDSVLYGLGMTKTLEESLKKNGIKYSVYDKTVPNPTIDNIEEALEQYKKNGHNGLIAVGGGSAMDCCKGVGCRVARPNKKIPQMKGVIKVMKKLPPLFAIPTTAGTGSETTLAAVVTNSLTHEKYAINDPNLIPKYAVLDPLMTIGLPPHITSTTGVDALTHAVEAFIGYSNTPKTKRKAIAATKAIFENLKKAYDNGKDVEARNNMQVAAYDAGVAFTRAYVGNVHAIAHTLGGFYRVPHGLANAVILPHMLDWYGKTAYKRLAILGREIGLEGNSDEVVAKKFIQAIRDLNKSMDIPEYIGSVIKDEDIPTMIKRAQAEANPLYPVPKIMDEEEMYKMYKLLQTEVK